MVMVMVMGMVRFCPGLLSIVESNFFTMSDETVVTETELALEALSLSCELAKLGR